MKVLVVEPMKPCEAREIPDTLEAMQAIVGGGIEATYPFAEPVAVICNAEGKGLDLPYNRPLMDESGLPYDIVCGTFFLTRVEGEHFASLTEEQLQKYKVLYDNVVVLTAERPENQAEIAPDTAMLDFAVACQISFRFTHEEQKDSEPHDAFISYVTGIFNNDETLAERTVGSLDVVFQGCCAEVRYTFARQDKDAASAEMFSKQCVLDVRDKLEGYGCKIDKIECFAEELEPDHMRDPVKKRGNQEKKKGTHHER